MLILMLWRCNIRAWMKGSYPQVGSDCTKQWHVPTWNNSKPGMVLEHSTEIMIWLLGVPYRLLLWLCRMGCYQPTWLWELNYIKLLHQSLSKHPVGFPPVSFTPHPGKTYQGMFTRASSTKSSLYHSWGIYLEMIQGGMFKHLFEHCSWGLSKHSVAFPSMLPRYRVNVTRNNKISTFPTCTSSWIGNPTEYLLTFQEPRNCL